jgi:rfaE bifunctional protein nucleotidyltransferase chain/domain
VVQNPKIKTIAELAKKVAELRSAHMKIVHCHGVFDLLHIGHIRYFKQAKQMGDILVVTVTPDRFVDKGPHRPAFPEMLRAESVASLDCVDFVAINESPTAEETLRLLRPDFYVKGSEFKNTSTDMTGKIAREEQVVREIGATLAFTEDIVFSSSNLINRYLSNFPEEMQEYLDLFRRRYTLEEVIDVLERMSSLSVLVIGDAIIDEYQYCYAIGKSSKDPVLALKYHSQDLFAGGVLAVANHVANFAKEVKLLTILGENDSYEEFIRSQLHANISPIFITKKNAPTVTKRRFIDGYSLNKLLEVYIIDDSALLPEEDSQVCRCLQEHLPQYDLVLAADFGHGAISKLTVNTLVENAPFLAINTQANAGNRGFHTVTRYPHADYICIAEHEIRLEMRDENGEIPPMMEELADKLGCSKFVVTRGRKGCYVCDCVGEFVAVPSFAQRIVDRVGAGDAFLSITALAAFLKAPSEVLGFIGNAVGSLAVEIVGNKKSIDKLSLKKYITALLK